MDLRLNDISAHTLGTNSVRIVGLRTPQIYQHYDAPQLGGPRAHSLQSQNAASSPWNVRSTESPGDGGVGK